MSVVCRSFDKLPFGANPPSHFLQDRLVKLGRFLSSVAFFRAVCLTMDFSVVSTKGRPMMHYKRKLFTKSKETRSADGLKIKVYWSCSKRGCRGSVNYAQTLDPDNPDHESIFSDISEREHNDLCTTTSVDILHRIARSDIIKQAATGASLGTVRAAVLDPLLLSHPTVAQTMQSAVSLQSSYSRAARASLPPTPPSGQMDQPFLVQFQTTVNGDQFLMFQENFSSANSDVNDSTILVFCTESFFREFCAASTIFVDGTFSACPATFSKYLALLTVRGSNGRFIPAMHCFLTGSTEDMYTRLFSLIKAKAEQLEIGLNWQRAVADYDTHLVNALRLSFPLMKVDGSHYHFIIAVHTVAYNLLKVRTSRTFLSYLLPPFFPVV